MNVTWRQQRNGQAYVLRPSARRAVHEAPVVCRTPAPRGRCFHFSFFFVSPEIRFATFTFLDHTVLHGQTK
ncbi:hypothetical protein [Burkholderia anthina]|uniref:hypothetical protein n=1 Tax=Burkholderia anthina TaxID=179879 RepID=UPI00158CB09B|nr:hypothetical protein [Burkholderia anthina]